MAFIVITTARPAKDILAIFAPIYFFAYVFQFIDIMAEWTVSGMHFLPFAHFVFNTLAFQ
jgi:hypothetical protein